MPKLFIVRHAPVTNKTGRIYGDEATIDLETTRSTLEHLAGKLPSPDKANWYHSGVDRAKRTAETVLSIMGIHEYKITLNKNFREQNFGDLIGQKHEDITDYLNFIDGKIFSPYPPNGESITNLIERVRSGLDHVKKESLNSNKKYIVIFSHGGTIRAVESAIKSLPAENFIDLNTPPLSDHEYDI